MSFDGKSWELDSMGWCVRTEMGTEFCGNPLGESPRLSLFLILLLSKGQLCSKELVLFVKKATSQHVVKPEMEKMTVVPAGLTSLLSSSR